MPKSLWKYVDTRFSRQKHFQCWTPSHTATPSNTITSSISISGSSSIPQTTSQLQANGKKQKYQTKRGEQNKKPNRKLDVIFYHALSLLITQSGALCFETRQTENRAIAGCHCDCWWRCFYCWCRCRCCYCCQWWYYDPEWHSKPLTTDFTWKYVNHHKYSDYTIIDDAAAAAVAVAYVCLSVCNVQVMNIRQPPMTNCRCSAKIHNKKFIFC